jgi:hypothetical protein
VGAGDDLVRETAEDVLEAADGVVKLLRASDPGTRWMQACLDGEKVSALACLTGDDGWVDVLMDAPQGHPVIFVTVRLPGVVTIIGAKDVPIDYFRP